MSDGKVGARRWAAATTVGDLFGMSAARFSHDAMVFPGERLTYPELDARSDTFARSLMAMGIGLRDGVGILLPNCMDHVIALLGIAKAGAVAVPINGRFRHTELRHVVRNSDMKILLGMAGGQPVLDQSGLIAAAIPDLAALGQQRTQTAPRLEKVVSFGPDAPAGWTARADFEAFADAVSPEALDARRNAIRVRDPAIMMFTSGTTSMPKAAILSHEAVTRQAANLADTRFMLGPDDRVWNPMPLFHIGGMAFGFACFARGATYVHAGAFDPGVSLRQLIDERCTVALPAFETLWLAVTRLPDYRPTDLSKLKLILNLGTPERLKRMQEELPNAIMISAFGATEGCSFLTAGRPEDPLDVRVRTLGSPMPGTEVKIVSIEDGSPVPPGTMGEILYRGPSMFDGYYGEPALTAEVIDAEGWFHSGDLGDVDAAGRLRYHGRLKDMIKVGGENVSALEVEEYLIKHPAILIAQVVSAPDDYYGEVCAAFLELAPGQAVTEQEVIDFCRDQIATFKIPRYVRVVRTWPMSGTKIKKVDLRRQIAEEMKAAGITEAPRIRSSRNAR
jgi:fatty-acyl-CoA synthase